MIEDRITRGDLPHWYRPGYAHFVTYRLVNTIPAALLVQWRKERAERIRRGDRDPKASPDHREIAHKRHFHRYDEYLDRQASVRWLADDRVASIVRENLYHHHETKYQLLAYCIMPSHVHVLLQPFEIVGQAASLPDGDGSEAGSFGHGIAGHETFFSDEVADSASPLSGIMHSLKSYTANRANEILCRTGQFWQHESYDHWVRDVDELERIVNYIRMNPVRASLCQSALEWMWSSAADRYAVDGFDCGLVGWLVEDWRRPEE